MDVKKENKQERKKVFAYDASTRTCPMCKRKCTLDELRGNFCDIHSCRGGGVYVTCCNVCAPTQLPGTCVSCYKPLCNKCVEKCAQCNACDGKICMECETEAMEDFVTCTVCEKRYCAHCWNQSGSVWCVQKHRVCAWCIQAGKGKPCADKRRPARWY